jgi:hypothetical protein
MRCSALSIWIGRYTLVQSKLCDGMSLLPSDAGIVNHEHASLLEVSARLVVQTQSLTSGG